uniref:Coatomer subunit epsilon n=1 Tax=Trypanosoma vivax (strain Y486) TaxID=1055687 RepID=G0U901_TRYVY|nr:putative coatomer epsilon subunit [Trypanosoma vivax Y486]
MADLFYDVRNALVVGNYHQAIAEASGVRTTSRKTEEVNAFQTEKETLLALGQIGLGQGEAVIAQLSSATNPVLIAVKNWATFCLAVKNCSDASQLTSAVEAPLQVLTEAAAEVSPERIQIAVFASSALFTIGNNGEALKLAKRWLDEVKKPQTTSMQRQLTALRAVVVEALLKIRRVDLARSEVRSMEQSDEESVLTVLYSGITSLYEGSASLESYHNAMRCFKEVTTICGQSVMISNLMALAQIGLGEFKSAEKCLFDALAVRPGDPDTSTNLAVVASHLGMAPDAVNRCITQAKTNIGPWSRTYAAMSAKFDEAVTQFKQSA